MTNEEYEKQRLEAEGNDATRVYIPSGGLEAQLNFEEYY